MAEGKPNKDGVKEITRNRKAFHNYFIEERYEAGIELFGTEVKSIRLGRLNLLDAYVQIEPGDQAILRGCHISPYDKGSIFNKDPMRPRRLLMHKSEIRKLRAQVQTKGFALIPLRVYLKQGLVKVEIALCRGKKLYDKRDDIAERDNKRELERTFKTRNQ